ncbi:carboxypeptidase-like regulatory domain-containing protein [Prolixibacteraceae bacterium Z1-6]|uniref:Carboxypeptidase-like regulatory domain-containing protein n=1 Tax=Draconibacterium aestuarii TaxID=2998507 RepID=A0A9X3F9B2_9BACT|nr:carboxypeptidase-like regulatory domain-containing protein [Prolixibacteraceae bacterium Z1-6]
MWNKEKIVVFIIVLTLGYSVYGQNTESIGQEEFIDLSTSQRIIFTGETLWFSVFSLNSQMQSSGSSLCLVELVNSSNASVIRRKVALTDGRGESYLQFPDSLSTGIYTILAYTSWMKNRDVQVLSKTKIAVINPNRVYENNKREFETNNRFDNTGGFTEHKGVVFNKRARVEVNKLLDLDNFSSGVYTLSVKRKEPDWFEDDNRYNPKAEARINHVEYFPDYNGIVVSGVLFDSDDRAVTGAEVLLSLPGNGADLMSSVTNEKGKFYFLLDVETGDKDLVFTLPDAEMRIQLDNPFLHNIQLENNFDFHLDSTAQQYLKEKYFYNQLANKYGERVVEKTNTDTKEETDFTFYTTPNLSLYMDDYIRLDSLSEYFYELVPYVHFNRVKKDYQLQVINRKSKFALGDRPGVFIDGVLYTDFDEMAKMPVEDIDRIDVIWELYYYKDFTFDGIVSVYTKKANFYSVDLQGNMMRIVYPMTDRNNLRFKVKEYGSEKDANRNPDLRDLLLWKPFVDARDLPKLNFFTSDISGVYEISITGYTSSGERISYSTDFYVE